VEAALRADELDDAIRALVADGQSSKEISDQLAPAARMPKREVYARAVALKSEGR
jgi:hypothetical protein